MRTTNRLTRILLAALPMLVLLQGQAAFAQEPGERGYIEVGIRQFFGDRASSKFSEYRHIPSGFYLQRFDLRLNELLGGKYFFSYQTRETLEKDQAHLLETGKHGAFRLQLRWDQTPHYFSNTTKTLYTQTGPGLYTVPTAIRSALQATPSAITGYLEGARPIHPTIKRNTGSGFFSFAPTAAWSVQVQYSLEKQTGSRPFGTTTNGFSNILELPEPVDYRTHLFGMGAEYASKHGGVQFGYSSSLFRNKVGELVWDNLFRAADTTTASSRGRLDLYPNNSAHNLSFAGAVNLPGSSRFMASVVPGWMRQNDRFLPVTINTAITGIPELPASSLNGKKSTLAMNYTFASNAIPSLPLTVRYRSYDYDNDTPSLIFSKYVAADASLGSVARRSLPYAFNRKNLEATAVWEFMKKSAFKFGYEWERYDRLHREVETSDEHTVGASLDLLPTKWLLLRTSYKRANREPKHYEANEEGFPLGEPATALGQLHDLRKFDEAARLQHRAEALMQMDPTDTLSLSAFYGTTQNDYRQTLYGMLKDVNQNFGFEITYSAHPSFSVFADYTKERFSYDQRSRQRTPPSATAPVNDSANNDWASDSRDIIDTVGAGIEGSALDNKVRFESYCSLSSAKGAIRTRALGVATIPGYLVTSAQNYPDTSNRYLQVINSVRFKVGAVYPKVEYRFEKYGRTDFQTGPMTQYMFPVDASTSTSLFLGADAPPYRVHILSVSLGYRF